MTGRRRRRRYIDLSEFESVSIDASYQSPGSHALRLMLANCEPGGVGGRGAV